MSSAERVTKRFTRFSDIGMEAQNAKVQGVGSVAALRNVTA